MPKNYAEIKLLWNTLGITKPLTQCLVIDVKQQVLHVYEDDRVTQRYSISTAKNGIGNEKDSYQTPYGLHVIGEKIGAQQAINTVFKARQATGEIAVINHPKYTQQDCITTRILWLWGLQEGINLSGRVDTKQRYIYIHGTPDEHQIGQAVSHACIRMKNADILELFEHIKNKAIVYIE